MPIRPSRTLSSPDLSGTYNKAKAAVLEEYDGDRSAHLRILKELFDEIVPCVPFPNHILKDNEKYHIEPKIIDVAPHEFELAKFIDKMNWITRLAQTKGGGSDTIRPERFASRDISKLRVVFARSRRPDIADYKLATAVMESGSCGDNTQVAESLAKSIDDSMLQQMDIHLDPEKLELHSMVDLDCDHQYSVFHYGEESLPLEPAYLEKVKRSVSKFPDDIDKATLWSMDSHAVYPMPARYDQSIYNHGHARVRESSRLGSPLATKPSLESLDLALARKIRQDMVRRLGLGKDGINKALQHDFMQRKKIGSKFVDRVKDDQGVSHYAAVDTTKLSEANRIKFEEKVDKIEREIQRKLVKEKYKAGDYRELWHDFCLPSNPAAVYRNSKTGEILMPTVPDHYLERTERMRWAYDVWKRTRPERSALNSPNTQRPTKFEISPAVEAIEKMPFLGALAAARAMNLSSNVLHIKRIADFEQALTSMEKWILRMHNDLSPDLVAKIKAVGLGDEVRDALLSVRANQDAFSDLIAKCEDVNAVSELRSRALQSKAWTKLGDLLHAFGSQ